MITTKIRLNNFSLFADKSEDNLLFSANKVEFRTGKMNLIMGSSGTGKTTLLNTLYGMKNHYLGHIQTDESEYDSKNISRSIIFILFLVMKIESTIFFLCFILRI